MSKKQENLDALKNLENQQEVQQVIPPMIKKTTSSVESDDIESSGEKNMLDGYAVLDRYDLPRNGELYPESWAFAYRCPTPQEVANFSTVHEKDHPAIINLIEDLIRKCVVIYDTVRQAKISTGNINDGDRTFFVMKLRELYLPGNPLAFDILCSLCHEKIEVNFTADKLIYNEFSQNLLNSFDGRVFSLDWPGIEDQIVFHIPTIDLSSRVFKYVMKAYRDANNDKDNVDKLIYDKQFMLFAPYLFENGTESVKEIGNRYQKLLKNETRFKAYLELISKLKFDNEDYIEQTCEKCESLEETQIRFPGGWKNFFVARKSTTTYFK